jgi:hypothetical protein
MTQEEKLMGRLICRHSGSAVVVLLLWTMAATADDQAKKIEVIKLEDAPKAVRDAIQGRFPGAKVVTTERETENGQVNFEVNLTYKDRKYELHIQEDGTISAIEKEIQLNDVPEAVIKAVKVAYPEATIQGAMEVSKVKDKKETPDHYLIAVKTGNKQKEIAVSLAGKLVR